MPRPRRMHVGGNPLPCAQSACAACQRQGLKGVWARCWHDRVQPEAQDAVQPRMGCAQCVRLGIGHGLHADHAPLARRRAQQGLGLWLDQGRSHRRAQGQDKAGQNPVGQLSVKAARAREVHGRHYRQPGPGQTPAGLTPVKDRSLALRETDPSAHSGPITCKAP